MQGVLAVLAKEVELAKLNLERSAACLNVIQTTLGFNPICFFVDWQGREFHLMEREDGSVSIYYTQEGDPAHYVVWDSLDEAGER